MVSITCLEFAYTQAPKSMKSLVMAVFLASVALGNYFTAGVNKFILVEKGDQESVSDTMKDTLKAADVMIREAFVEGKHTLPDTEAGTTLLSSLKDEWGTPLHYRMVHKNLYKITSLGPDKETLTSDDITHEVTVSRPDELSETSTTFSVVNASAGQGATPLASAHERLRTEFFYTNQVLPETEAGQAMIDGSDTAFSGFVGYVRLGDDRYALYSPFTGIETVLIDRATTEVRLDDRPLTWRENRMIELMGDEGRKAVERERGGVAFIEYDTALKVGGQVKLEGAAYFWFWTWTMLGTAILFVFVAVWYTPRTYLQEEAPADEDESHGDALLADA